MYAALFWVLGLYRGLWRYASLPDLQRILPSRSASARSRCPRVVTLLAAGRAGAAHGVRPDPRAARAGHGRQPPRVPGVARGTARADPRQAAGDAGAGARRRRRGGRARSRSSPTSPQWRVVGMLDDDVKKHGAAVAGVKIYGGIDRVGELAAALGVSQAVIAMPSATHQQRKRALDLCAQAGSAGDDGARRCRTSSRARSASPRCARSSSTTCSAATRSSSTTPRCTRSSAARWCW